MGSADGAGVLTTGAGDGAGVGRALTTGAGAFVAEGAGAGVLVATGFGVTTGVGATGAGADGAGPDGAGAEGAGVLVEIGTDAPVTVITASMTCELVALIAVSSSDAIRTVAFWFPVAAGVPEILAALTVCAAAGDVTRCVVTF